MKIKRTQKGEMLIETVVSMAVFFLMVATFFSVYKSFSSASKRQNAYIFFESECLSIDSYYDSLGINHETGDDYWAQDFFGDYYHRATMYDEENNESVGYQMGYQRYDSGFNRVRYDNPLYKYTLTYTYTGDGMVVNVEDKEDGYMVINDLKFGQSEVDTLKDVNYIKDIMEKNVGIRRLKPDEKRYIEDNENTFE